LYSYYMERSAAKSWQALSRAAVVQGFVGAHSKAARSELTLGSCLVG
jgi:hypothetical protein